MIRFESGSVFDYGTQAIVNTVNTVGVMGKGLALEFKKRHHYNYLQYKNACVLNQVKVGEMFITEEHDLFCDNYIINFPTKKHWRNPSEYEWIEFGLFDLRRQIIVKEISSITIPLLGCSNGGLDSKIIIEMIEKSLHGLDNVDIIIALNNE